MESALGSFAFLPASHRAIRLDRICTLMLFLADGQPVSDLLEELRKRVDPEGRRIAHLHCAGVLALGQLVEGELVQLREPSRES